MSLPSGFWIDVERMCFNKIQHSKKSSEEFIKNSSVVLRSYECPLCGHFHLTSQPSERKSYLRKVEY